MIDPADASSDPAADAPTVVGGLREVGAALARVGYSAAGLRRVLAVPGTDIPFAATDIVGYQHRLSVAAGPLATVATVFCLGQACPTDQVAAALGRPALDALSAARAVTEESGEIRALVRILPHGELLVASDRRPGGGTPAGPLHVTGINAPATLLASLTVRQPGARVLDLGTGNGIQALLAAAHAATVVATDVNPRALAFGRFNAALNGIDGIEFRLGSWFEPVAGQRFDLVVSNPPYVISPQNDLVYRDSGDEPGALCGRLVRDVPEYLTSEGFSTFLVSWPLRGRPGASSAGTSATEDPWWAVPASWLGPDSVAWVLMMRREDPLTHATQWNLPLATGRPADRLRDYRAAVDRWAAYLAERAIDGIGYGAVIQRRRAGAGRLIRADEARSGSGSAGPHIQRVFAAADALGGDPERTVSIRGCAVPAEARLDSTLVPTSAGWVQGAAQLGLAEGVGIRADLDPVMTEVLLTVTGGAGVDDAAAAVAARMDLSAADADRLAADARRMLAELVGLGLLELGADPAERATSGSDPIAPGVPTMEAWPPAPRPPRNPPSGLDPPLSRPSGSGS
jgi:SAM-dependent methyltransferase